MNTYADLHSFIVDPQRDGIDNALWKVVSGTPAVSSNKFRFNTAEGLVRADLLYGRFVFSATIPLSGVQTPTNLNNNLEFGLKNLSLGNKSKMSVLFNKTGDIVTFTTYDKNGITAQSTDIVHDTTWNGVISRFIIDWFYDRIVLSVVNVNTEVEKVLATHKTRVGQHPVNLFAKATGNDNLDLDYICVEKAKGSSLMLI